MTDPTPTRDPLEVLFPEKTLTASGLTIKITPLSLQNLPKVVEAFGVLMRLAEANMPPSQIATAAMKELLEILPYCLDVPIEKIPASLAPEIIDIVLDQNLTEAVVGKWTALIQRIAKSVTQGQSQIVTEH
jgi:hypothetical protein